MKPKPHILPVIVFSQFACTSLWFTGNALVDELAAKTEFGNELIGYILSSVQLGFILGTLLFALLTISDRFSPSKVFMVCALLASICNLSLLLESDSKIVLLTARFGTGFFLAGIYPVGMKIASDYYEKGLGRALGYLVGALVFGKSFPFLVKSLAIGKEFQAVLISASVLAVIGGIAMLVCVPDGPFRKPGRKIQLSAGPALFKITEFRKAAFGYFGHMWELYAFWGLVPYAIVQFNTLEMQDLSVSLWTSIIIGLGGISCILGGYLALQYGSKRIAMAALTISGVFCMISPAVFLVSPAIFLSLFCLWGMAVVADSPQFSSLVAQAAPPELKGTGLTLVNCLGFALSIVSIELVSWLIDIVPPANIFILLALGPAFGLWQLSKGKLH